MVICTRRAAAALLGVALAAGASRGAEAERGVPEVAEKVLPSVVTLHVSRRQIVSAALPPELERFFGQEFREEPPPRLEPFLRRQFREDHGASGLGSGVIVSEGGLVATNAHVVEGATAVTAEFASGAKVPAEVVGSDARTDIAVVRLKGGGPFRALEFAPPRSLRAGDRVTAVGSPMGFPGSVTAGVVSHPGRYLPPEVEYLLGDSRARGVYYGRLIQTDALVNAGSSGGALVDERGRLVGMTVILYESQSRGMQGVPGGVMVLSSMVRGPGFAIPVGKLARIVPVLSEGREVEHGYLGIAPKTASPEMAEALGVPGRRGVLVDFVEGDSPASRAGLAAGDVILSMNGTPTPQEGDIVEGVGAAGPESEVEFDVVSPGGEPRTVRATLAKRRTARPRPRPPAREPEGSWRGILFEDAAGQVRVARVASGSPGARAGLAPMMRVKEAVICGERVAAETADAFRKALAAAQGPVALLTDKAGYLAVPAE